jgi:hypothetical protein
VIPLAGPAAYNDAVFVKDAVEKSVVFSGIFAQLGFRVLDAGVLVVAVELEEIALAVGYRLRARQSIRRPNDGGSTPRSRNAFSISLSKLVVMITRT